MGERNDVLRDFILLLSRRLEVGEDRLLPETELADVGVDSVELAFVFSYFERDTGVRFEDAEVDASRYRTIGSLTDLLVAKIASAGGQSAVLDGQ